MIENRSPRVLEVALKLDKTLIADLPLFAGFEARALENILERAHAVHYPKGKVVFSQNENAQSFFLLLHGRLRVTQVTPQGEQIVVRFVNPGDLFGIALAIGRTTYPGTATAAADSLALLWPSAAWPEIMSEYPSLAANAMRMVGSRLQEAHQRVRELSTEDVERRLAHTVLKLAQDAGVAKKSGVEIDFPVSRQDLAEMTASTLHTVSRIISSWEASGILEGGRQRVAIRDEARLRAIANRNGQSSD
jgi:CRP-like cAMP-binding protein